MERPVADDSQVHKKLKESGDALSLLKLPGGILLNIVSFLDTNIFAIYRLSMTCKRLNTLTVGSRSRNVRSKAWQTILPLSEALIAKAEQQKKLARLTSVSLRQFFLGSQIKERQVYCGEKYLFHSIRQRVAELLTLHTIEPAL